MLNDLTDRINLLFVWSGPDALQADVEMSADANLSLNHNLAAGYIFFPLFFFILFFFFKLQTHFTLQKKIFSMTIEVNWEGSLLTYVEPQGMTVQEIRAICQ